MISPKKSKIFLAVFLIGSIGVKTQEQKHESVLIGDQIWATKNLDIATFRNGDPIPEAQNRDEWIHAGNNGLPAWCHYGSNPENEKIYGKLYNWFAVIDPRGLAPEGWHIPTGLDWKILSDYLLGHEVAGGQLKERGTTHWESPNTDATNSTAFTALPGGIRGINADYSSIGTFASFWSAWGIDSTHAEHWYLYYGDSYLWNDQTDKRNGFSVRLVKDNVK